MCCSMGSITDFLFLLFIYVNLVDDSVDWVVDSIGTVDKIVDSARCVVNSVDLIVFLLVELLVLLI